MTKNPKNTIISSGHIDVVSAEVYGREEDLAFQMDGALEAAIAGKAMSADARADLESGEWIWGRGVADMKGGMAIHTELFADYAAMAEKGELTGSLLFMPVPDEESYSAGMREGAVLMHELKAKYDLNFILLVDPEPNTFVDGAQIMAVGSVGKTMPVVLAQGERAHVGNCFGGISAVGILANIFSKSDSSLLFSDSYEGESTMPPTWTNFRDKKDLYDVSIPHRATGYMTVLSFYSTPDETLGKLKALSVTAFEEYVAHRNAIYQEYKKIDKYA